MERLMDIYDQIEDPLNDKDNLIEIIKAGIYDDQYVYGKIQDVYRINNGKKRNEELEKKFYERNKQKYLKNHPNSVTDLDEDGKRKWMRIQKNPNPFAFGAPGFYHIYSKKLFNKTSKEEQLEKVRHRFYVNVSLDHTHEFAMLFEDKCEKAGIPYHYKFSAVKRSDMFIVYANTLYLDKYLEILREIKKENPELCSHTGKPPVLTGVIDGWIGYGSEPAINDEIKAEAEAKGEDAKQFSFTDLRAKAISKVVKEISREIIENNLNTKIDYHGKQILFKEYIAIKAAEQAYQEISPSIEKVYKDHPNVQRKDYKSEIIKKAKNNVDFLINAYFNDREKLKIDYNPVAFEWIANGNGAKRYKKIDKEDMDAAIGKIIEKIIIKNPQLEDRYRKAILKEFEAKGIDTKKTCFDNDIVDNMKKRDIKYQLHGGFDGVSIEPAPSNPVIAKIIEQENQQKKPKKNDNVRFLTLDELNKVFGETPVKDQGDAKKVRFSTPEIMKEQVAKKGHIPDGHLKVGDYNKENIDEAIALYDKILAGLNKKDFKPLNPDEIRNLANREHFEPYDHAIMELPHHPKEDELKAMFAKESDKWGKEGKGRVS